MPGKCTACDESGIRSCTILQCGWLQARLQVRWGSEVCWQPRCLVNFGSPKRFGACEKVWESDSSKGPNSHMIRVWGAGMAMQGGGNGGWRGEGNLVEERGGEMTWAFLLILSFAAAIATLPLPISISCSPNTATCRNNVLQPMRDTREPQGESFSR